MTRKRFGMRTTVSVLGAMLSIALLNGAVFADHGSTNNLERDDSECQAAGYDFGYKLDGVDGMDASDSGTYTSEDHVFSVDLTFHEEGGEITSFDFDNADPAVSGVLVVGGPPGPNRVNVYDYDPAVESDEGLERTGGGGISHITFCFLIEPTPTPVEETPTPTPVEETPTPTPVEETPTPTPVEETPTPTPVEETPTPTPVEETPTPTPVEETPTPTPVEETPTPTPTDEPTPTPTDEPTPTPTDEPTPTPTDEPTPTPTDEPTPTPTEEPSPTPTLPDTATSIGGEGGPSNLTLVLLAGLAAAAWLFLRPVSPTLARERQTGGKR